MVLSVGEDLFSVLVVVGLAAVFIAALAHSYHVYAERRNAFEDFGLALDIAERVKNQLLTGQNDPPALLELSHERLENYSRLLALQGVNLRVEVRALDGELLFAHGPEFNPLEQYFSPPVGVSLPVAVVQNQGSARGCELSVQVWRG
ncbi:MAG: hypothetical protein QMD95_04330 [Candidatus Hodarchaeaceae archaeon]|nr:hypothetical protein [Candidatus Hodarchaeaceae archaeon]